MHPMWTSACVLQGIVCANQLLYILVLIITQKQEAARREAEFACLLCQRGFASEQQLRKHELKSKLHAENLAKAGHG